jgi:hypothetical protein
MAPTIAVKSARNIAIANARRQPARISFDPINIRCMLRCGGVLSSCGNGLEPVSGGTKLMADLPSALTLAFERHQNTPHHLAHQAFLGERCSRRALARTDRRLR